MVQINFNAAATQAINNTKGSKLRMEVRNGVLFVRPTDRKAGPHVLAELVVVGRGRNLAVNLDDGQLERLEAGNLLENNATYNLVEDKYGWFALRAGDEADEKTIEGASATVKASAKAENAKTDEE